VNNIETDTYNRRFHVTLETMRRKLKNEMSTRLPSSVTGPQIYMLYFIREQGTCKLTYLADKMEVKASAITVMIDRLENAGLVCREHDAADRRVVMVRLTGQGDELVKQVEQTRDSVLDKLLSRLGQEELETFIGTFEKLVRDED
jgi:DNA-binding MarR family transcriptional regulator